MIVAFIVAIFNMQISSLREAELDAVCERIQLPMDEVSSLNDEATVLFTYGEGSSGEAIKLPEAIGGDHYVIDFYTVAVLIKQDGRGGKATFQTPIHLFYPGDISDMTSSDLRTLDAELRTLRVAPSEEFRVERRHFPSSGYQTFVYRAGSEDSQEPVRELAEAIDAYRTATSGSVEMDSADADAVILPNFVVLRDGGYAGVAQVHVNFTFDPRPVWSDGEVVELDELSTESRVRNERIEVPKGGKFTLERYTLRVSVQYSMSPDGQGKQVLEIVESFIHVGE